MLTADDCKLLTEKMGKKWYAPVSCPNCGVYCSGKTVFCTPSIPNPTFTTPAELWELLMWAMRQEWWKRFHNDNWFVFMDEGEPFQLADYTHWLLAPDRFPALVAEWVRRECENA